VLTKHVQSVAQTKNRLERVFYGIEDARALKSKFDSPIEMSARQLEALKEKHVAAKHMVFQCVRKEEDEDEDGNTEMVIKEEIIPLDSNTNQKADMEDVEMEDS
jgi:hypothetical protein